MEKGKIKEFKIPISLVMIALTLLLFVILSVYYFSLSTLPTDFQHFVSTLGNWSYYIFVLSLVGLLYFAYILVSTDIDRRKFEELMNSDSKATFTKNTRDLETVSRKLGPSFVRRFKQKKDQLRIK